MISRSVDAIVFGGGIAGLWILDRLCARGYRCLLLESDALGRGQTVQAQGIVHGGGKYALRSVRDLAAMESIREMPARWTGHLDGYAAPDLSAARWLSRECHLWVPRSGWRGWLSAWGVMPLVVKAGMLSARPIRQPASAWPKPLREAAQVVYAMPEPVVATGSVLRAFRTLHEERLLRYFAGPEASALEIEREADGSVRLELSAADGGERVELRARQLVLAAGAGNESLLRRAGCDGALMQRRPLRMVMLKGPLPPLFAHCVLGGKTGLTVTAHPIDDASEPVAEELVWQLGGELAEGAAEESDPRWVERAAVEQLRRLLPRLPLRGVRVGSYPAVRAEALRGDARRPSGVHASRVQPGILVAWPTKMALAPVLADEVARLVQEESTPALGDGMARRPEGWPLPDVAPYPWKEATWNPVD